MRVVIAIDSFKGSLSSTEAGSAVRDAVCRLYKDAQVTVKPIADGGEGTVDAFTSAANAEAVEIEVSGPLSKKVKAKYCILKDTGTAVIEIAQAAGITLIDADERDPMKATTYGVGELIRDAIKRGCRRFIVGIGGSATNDGGVGMLTALGYEFLDKDGEPIPLCGEGLKELREIKARKVIPELSECIFNVACDVKNPLCGENGCSAVYGPQKGATPEIVKDMDAWLGKYAELTKNVSDKADSSYAGAGAAGGLGFAFLHFLKASLEPGAQIVLEQTGIEAAIKNADLVITGEGRLDGQSVMGKAPVGVAALSKKYGKTVVAFCGCIGENAELCNEYGIDAYFSIAPGAVSLEEAMDRDNAYNNLKNTAKQVLRLIRRNS